MRLRHRRALVLIAVTTLASTAAAGPVQASPRPPDPEKAPVATGYGGAVATVDLDATKVGLEVLRKGGNAVDAAIAAAATLGVTEPFSAGIGGGGFLVYYSAKDRRVYTIDGREAAPMSMGSTAFVDPVTGLPYAFQEARVSGIAAGVPGTLATWDKALRKWGTTDLADALRPAAKVADRGFVVDNTFRTQISDNAAAFGQFSSTSELYLPGGAPPVAGTVFRNPDLADTYRLIARQGTGVFYRGAVARDIVDTVRHPPVADVPIGTWAFPIRPGTMALSDLAAYQVRTPSPTRVSYRGYDVYGMPTPSSGGQAVGEALNILEQTDLSALTRTEALHQYLEASALAFADRNRFVGDNTPRPLLDQLLSDGFAKERACLINPAQALVKPVAPGEPDGAYGGCAAAAPSPAVTEGQSTTNLTVADRWGNVVEYTLTIEQTGGNAMVVPGRGFLLNNEMTDFNFTPTQGSAPDPNLPGPGKRPRSSMAPTIVLADGRPFLAVGTPGGSTIITTVLQILVNRLDLGMTLPEAVAAARATQRNTAAVLGEAEFAPEIPGLTALGHTFAASPEIGAATGIEFLGHGRLLAAAEPVRRGGGSAGVVWPVAGS
ncbi:gamma-glutamyltranspeptidase [Catellatospora chokoriensis]|uniref:Glutathione hydrolase proenzyme n=1 Tax=Catellatospora chokoriensis TaxID=310353 RepID=A0A8J3K5V9_9ACTN|nr:gamma-glutamyltransferase [Catellatospora chokoriensis]GIF93367.1 gamma-glutamyltranspeptidase [Catellatospora chokoriensis]